MAAVVLMAGISFAGGIDHGSWEEYTAMTQDTVNTDNQLARVNGIDRRGKEPGTESVVLSYEDCGIKYVTLGGNEAVGGTPGVSDEHYGIAPSWGKPEGASEMTPKDEERTPEMDRFLE